MKVLHVSPSAARVYGGPTYSLAGFANAAILDGADVSIAAPAPPRDDKWLAEAAPEAKLYSFRTYGRGAFLASADLHSWVRRNGAQFDVIHIHGLLNPVSSLAARACVRNRWPFVIRPFGTLSRYTSTHRRGTLKVMYRFLLDAPNLERASAVHFTTHTEEAESAWQNIDWGSRAFIVPPPWMDAAEGMSSRANTEANAILFLSRLHPVKNVELLLEAWPAVQRSLPDAELIIAGDGDPTYVATLRARAERLSPAVRLVGFANENAKRGLLQSANLFVLPSRHENFGIAVLEALAMGLPAVVTSEVQLSAFVLEHSLGVLSGSSAESLSSAIIRALNDRVLRERCRKQGRTLVARYFSTHTIGAQLLDMYRFAIANPYPT